MAPTTLIAADRLFDGTSFRSGWVRIEGGTIVEVGDGVPPAHPDLSLPVLAPGFVDVHCHGGGGASFVTEDPADVARAAATHLAHGTTTVVASLVTGSTAALERQVDVLTLEVERGTIAGIHLEGPWLAPEYRGAHDPALLVIPAPADVAALVDRGRGTIRMVTIAPELPGALESIALLAARGVVAAVGHTGADHGTTRAAIAAGATGATHLFNAMPPMHHRAPGPVLALWAHERVFVELIVDGVHVAPELAAFVMATAPDRSVLVTDAMAAAGSADGDYVLGDLPVEVRDGVARLAGTDTIAGSTLTLDRAICTAVAAGVDLTDALRAATSTPARHLGLHGVGRIAAGHHADLGALDDGLAVTHVMRHGQAIHP